MIQGTNAMQREYDKTPYQMAELTISRIGYPDIVLTNADIVEDGMTLDRYSSNDNLVIPGTCISAELRIKINNHDGRFDGVDFVGAIIDARVRIATISNALRLGIFYVYGHPRNTTEIEIVAYDKLTRLDRPLTYNIVGITGQDAYISINNALNNVMDNCGFSRTEYYFGNHPIKSKYIKGLPITNETITCRQFVAWICALMGCFMFCDQNGRVQTFWYETFDSLEESETDYYNCLPSNRYNFDFVPTSIEITGLYARIPEQQSVVVGSGPDYTIDYTNNGLINDIYNSSSASPGYTHYGITSVLNIVSEGNQDIIGTYYYPYAGTIKPAPYLWPGDPVAYTVYEKNVDSTEEEAPVVYSSTITHVTYKLNGATYIAADGQTKEEHFIAIDNGDGVAFGESISGCLTVAGTASFSGDIAVPSGGLLKVVRITLFSNVSIAADSNKTNTYTITSSDIGTGWTAVGIIGYSMGQGTFNVYRLRLAVDSTDTIEYSVRNIDSSAHTGSLGCMVLCIRTSL